MATQCFLCSSEGKNDTKALQTIQTYVDGDSAIQWLSNFLPRTQEHNNQDDSQTPYIAGPPQVHFLAVENKLRLLYNLKNGKTKSKLFPCSRDGKNDLAAMNHIHQFIDSPDFNIWLEENEWIDVCSVTAGIDTRRMIENRYQFDIRKEFCVDKSLTCKYDQDTLDVSVTKNENWGKTHRLDET